MFVWLRWSPFLFVLTTSPFVFGQATDDLHLGKNSLYREVLDKGVTVGAAHALKFPAPTIPDGLDKQGQLKALEKLAGDDYPLDELTRNSIVAPHILKFRDIDVGDDAKVGRGVDLWFIAYGNLDKVTSAQLQSQFLSNRKDNQVTQLKDADLARRGIKVKNETEIEESYVHAVGAILDRVQVRSTNQTVISRTKDSIVMAARLDPRFNKDGDFPNQWRSITLVDDKEQFGVIQPYEGAGMYVRMTKLHEPAGAIFIELHQVFAEPKTWFNAPNMLRSKLPIVIQAEVRAFRRELAKVK